MPSKRPAPPTLADQKSNAALDSITGLFTAPAPPPVKKVRGGKADGNFTASCKPQAICLKIDDVKREAKGAPTTKRAGTFLITGVNTNGANDIIRSGVPGEDFLIPSILVEAPTLPGAPSGADAKTFKTRELLFEQPQRARKIGLVYLEFYKDAGQNAKDPAQAVGINSCVAGSKVEISGLVANAVEGKGVYLNASSATPTSSSDTLSDANLAKVLMTYNDTAEMQAWSAFGCSISSGGFFKTDGLNAAQKRQAEFCHAKWRTSVEGVADRLNVMASGKDEAVAGLITKHEERIRGLHPKDLASGNTNMFVLDVKDSSVAPMLMTGQEPWDPTPGYIRKLKLAAAGSTDPDLAIPPSFAAVYVTNVDVVENLLSVEMGAAVIFDIETAIEDLEAGVESPVLNVQQCMNFNLSMKDFAVKLGSMLVDKASMGIKEILRCAELAAYPKLHPHSPGDPMKSEFPGGGTLFIDMPKTLAKGGVLVSLDWLKKSLCGGGTQLIPPKTDKPKYDLPDKHSGEMPFLEKHHYQELTYESFDLEDMNGLPEKMNKKLEFRVVYSGVYGDLGANKELASDASKGEAHLAAASDMSDAGTVKKFLTGQCLVYATLN